MIGTLMLLITSLAYCRNLELIYCIQAVSCDCGCSAAFILKRVVAVKPIIFYRLKPEAVQARTLVCFVLGTVARSNPSWLRQGSLYRVQKEDVAR